MKGIRKLVGTMVMGLCAVMATAQGAAPIPIEVFFGNNRLATQITVNRRFNATTKFGVFANTMTAADYDNKLNERNQIDRGRNNTESMNSLYLTYDFYKGLGLIGGAGLNSNWGFRPFAGGRYGYGNKVFRINVSSGFYLTQTNNFENKMAVLFTPQLTQGWLLNMGVQALYNQDMDTNKHDRGALYGRIGVSHKAFGVGLATNLDWYGPNKVLKENYGVYVSYTFR